MRGAVPHGNATGSAPRTVVVVGGGIAGLAAAWALTSAEPAARVVVLEATERLGGKVHSSAIGGRAVDLGPDAFLARRPEAVALCRELGLGDELVSPASRRAFVWARGRLRPLPPGLALGVPTRWGPLARSGILSPLGAGRVALDLLRWPTHPHRDAEASADRPIADITRRRLGREVTASLTDPLIGGIHAGDTTQMSAAAVFPALLAADAHGGSLMRALRVDAPSGPPVDNAHHRGAGAELPVFHTVRGGLGRLVDALADQLRGRGVEVQVRAPVEHLERCRPHDGERGREDRDAPGWALRGVHQTWKADAVIIATPARAAAALLESVDASVATQLAAIDYAEVTLLTLVVPTEGMARPLDGTGFLVPADAGCLMTACTWLTSKWPYLQRPGDVLLRASMGRFGDERARHMADDEIVEHVVAELGAMLGLRARPTEAVVTRWHEAFPQYPVGHLERVCAIEQAVARLPAMALAGAAYRGVGIPACIASGRRAADAVLGRPVVTGQPTP